MSAAPFRLYNTLSRQIEDFEPIDPGKIRMYVCGMTVYDDAHVGHARAMVFFDLVYRYLTHRGWDVNFVRNFTDVDDKIIARAKETGEEPIQLAERYIERFCRDAAGLELKSPTSEPRVSTSIPDILEMIGMLVERGHAYENNGSVWFKVRSDDGYGRLSGQKVDDLRASPDLGDKLDPLDFALWKAEKPGEPAWDSPWGRGRPGWHIECSAMARAHLGDEIDIHGGGLDLVFPHHENEIAQSQCATGRHYVRYWMHNGLLVMRDGVKMGKSENNAFNICKALNAYPAEAIRLYYLQAHYRSPLPWNADALTEALAMLARLYEAREVAEEMGGSEPVPQLIESLGADARTVHELATSFEERFYAAMDEDFNTAKAIGHAFELARAINRLSNHKKAKKRAGPVVAPALEAFALLERATGLMAAGTDAFQDEVRTKRLKAMGVERQSIEDKLQARTEARASKDWAQADAIRAELEQLGITVMDCAGGVEWRIRL